MNPLIKLIEILEGTITIDEKKQQIVLRVPLSAFYDYILTCRRIKYVRRKNEQTSIETK